MQNPLGDAWRLLKADLGRQFEMEGDHGKDATFIQILKRSVHPRFFPLILCRFSRALFLMKIPGLPFLLSYLNLVIFGLQITPRCDIGPGFFIPHPSGIVIGAWRIGRNVTIFQQVTLGAKTVDLHFVKHLLPEVCDNVMIGAGAKVLGGIRIGESAVVGANAVVIDSVEPSSTVVGIPARKRGRIAESLR